MRRQVHGWPGRALSRSPGNTNSEGIQEQLQRCRHVRFCRLRYLDVIALVGRYYKHQENLLVRCKVNIFGIFSIFTWSLRNYCCLIIDYGWDNSEATIANSLDVSYWFAADIRWRIFACRRPKTSVPVWSLQMNHCPISKKDQLFLIP